MSTPADAVIPSSFTDALSRMQQLEAMVSQLSNPSVLTPAASGAAAVAPSSATAFQQALSAATAAQTAPVGASGANAGQTALQVAETQVGVTEQPPGSNDGPQIAQYRTATQGAYAGAPWCAYFVSWCAAEAGSPDRQPGPGPRLRRRDHRLGAVDRPPDPDARAGRADPLRYRARRHRQVGQPGRFADDRRGQRLGRCARRDALALRGHRLRPARLATPDPPPAGGQSPSQIRPVAWSAAGAEGL